MVGRIGVDRSTWSLVPLGPDLAPLLAPSPLERLSNVEAPPGGGIGVVTGPLSGVWAGSTKGATIVVAWPGGSAGLWPTRQAGKTYAAGTIVPIVGPGVTVTESRSAQTPELEPGRAGTGSSGVLVPPPASAWDRVAWPDVPPPIPWERAPDFGSAAAMISAIAANTGANPSMVGLLAVGLLSLPLSSRVLVVLDGQDPDAGPGARARVWTEHAALFALALAPSGFGKSPIFDALLAPFLVEAARVDRESREEAAAHNARVAAARAVLKRGTADASVLEEAARVAADGDKRPRPLFAANPTPAALVDLAQRYPTISLVSQEATSFLLEAVRDGSADVQGLLHLYAGEPFAGVARIGRPTNIAPGARLRGGVVGAIQPGAFHGLAQVSAYADLGLIARFLFAAWDPTYADAEALRTCGRPIPAKTSGGWASLVARLYAIPEVGRGADGLDLAPLRRALVAPEGTELLLDFRHRLREQSGFGGDLHGIEAWCNKAHGQAARIAGLWAVVAAAQRPDFVPAAAAWEVPTDYVEAAIELVETHLLQHAAAVHRLAAWPKGTDVARDLWARMRGLAVWTWADLEARQGLVPSSPTQLQEALDALIARGFLRASPGSGRARVYWPNPKADAAGA